jgi:hypothetical protein
VVFFIGRDKKNRREHTQTILNVCLPIYANLDQYLLSLMKEVPVNKFEGQKLHSVRNVWIAEIVSLPTFSQQDWRISDTQTLQSL